MTMGSVVCPHCGNTSVAGAFCARCGKALPSSATSGPRIVDGDALPQSAAGQKLMGDELKKHTNRAAYTLLAVGLLQLTCGAILVALIANAPGGRFPPGMVGILMVVQFVVALVFIGLFFWARVAPLPASIVGLVIYATLVLLNILTAVSELGQEGPRRGIGGLGVGGLDILIIVFLVQGIQAGLKHKRLMESAATL